MNLYQSLGTQLDLFLPQRPSSMEKRAVQRRTLCENLRKTSKFVVMKIANGWEETVPSKQLSFPLPIATENKRSKLRYQSLRYSFVVNGEYGMGKGYNSYHLTQIPQRCDDDISSEMENKRRNMALRIMSQAFIWNIPSSVISYERNVKDACNLCTKHGGPVVYF